MPSVYVSSTYEDLKPYRRAVFEAIRRLRHVPVGMEDYSAEERRPIETCLSDVRESQAYVGIVGWRYGSTPPGHSRSFTELEYCEAGEAGIPRFVFLTPDAWPNTLRDSDAARITTFRAAIQDAHVVRRFDSVDQLKFEVVASLSRISPGYEIPPLLAWHCDRLDQYEDMSAGVKPPAGEEQQTKPVILFAHAHERQALNRFVECVKEKISSILNIPEHNAVHWAPLHWPKEAALDSFRSVLLRRLELAFGKEAVGKIESVAAKLDSKPEAVVLYSRVYSDDWQTEREECISSAFRIWQEIPLKKRIVPTVLFVTLEYREARNFLQRWKVERLNSQIRDTVQRLNRELCGASFSKIRELDDVVRFDVDDWGNLPEVQAVVGGADLTSDIANLFRNKPALPMRPLGEDLVRILHRRAGGREK